jgi:hypothetical protein
MSLDFLVDLVSADEVVPCSVRVRWAADAELGFGTGFADAAPGCGVGVVCV